MLKVLIVEDSELISDILTEALESDKQVQVVGVARNGAEAIEMAPQLNPDLITMDVWMPVMDGFITVERIMADFPKPILVITSSSLKDDVQLSLRMLAAGALDVIEKPSFQDESQWERNKSELLAKIHLLAGIKVVRHIKGRKSTLPSSVFAPPSPRSPFFGRDEDKATKPLSPAQLRSILKSPMPPKRASGSSSFPTTPFYQLVAIASSTGGPTALLNILGSLPPDFPAAILVVQHISKGFTQGLVEWLQREIKLKVCIATENAALTPGNIFVAPDRLNLLVKNTLPPRLTLSDAGEEFLRPNADALLNSVAQVLGEKAVGVVLTGMGSDGAKGLKAMSQRGAYTIAQDEATSLIYGMPKAAVENNAVRQSLPLNQIGSALTRLLQIPA